jgi:hypothetical protein
MSIDTSNFGRYLSPTGNGYATRFGAGWEIIGAIRDPKTGRIARVDTSMVVALTHDETRTFRREYDRQLRDGALIERTLEDYLAYVASQSQPAPPAPASDEKKDRPRKSA